MVQQWASKMQTRPPLRRGRWTTWESPPSGALAHTAMQHRFHSTMQKSLPICLFLKHMLSWSKFNRVQIATKGFTKSNVNEQEVVICNGKKLASWVRHKFRQHPESSA